MLTNRENYMRMMRGELPESIPEFNFKNLICPEILKRNRTPQGGFDCFGVEYVTSPESNNGAIPKPNNFMIEDITKWRDIVTKPDLAGIDWEAMAKHDLANVDRDAAPVTADMITGFFQALINYMGFTEGLTAIYEEPEEVAALMEWVTDFYIEVAKNMIKYYKPDMCWMPDDVATARSPFMSKDQFEELFLPSWKRFTEVWLDAGIPVELHCCGQCMDFVDDFVEIGISAWDPAQVANDLSAVKAKYGRKLAIVGGFDGNGFGVKPGVTEEEMRAEVRRLIDQLAPDGGFAFNAGVMIAPGQEHLQIRNEWIHDEFNKIAPNYYSK